MTGDAAEPLLLLGPQHCADVDLGATQEWLLTDGLGGYAMGTASGLRTRRYHGLLVVATRDGRPSDPVDGVSGRHLGLAALDAVLVVGERRVRLGTHEWSGGVVDPVGTHLLCAVELRPGSVVHRWTAGDVVVEREIAMAHGTPAVAVVHRVVRSPGPVRLELSALGTWRDVHGERFAGGGDPQLYPAEGGVVVDGAWRLAGPGFAAAGQWYRGVRYREEAARGLNDVEDLWHVGDFAAELVAGQGIEVLAWAGQLDEMPPPAEQLVSAAQQRAADLLHRARTTSPALFPDPAGPRSRAATALVLAADQFVTTGPGVVAGYPWFGEWSRDTMTSYEGLFLVTGRHEEGATLLKRYAATVSQGMLANTADAGGLAYNTADATPWFLHAVRRHVDVTGDVALGATLLPILLGIVDAHVAGTRYGIRVDPADGLLSCGITGDPGTDATLALTWMDARIDGRGVTPRHGKPVEVNALWVNGLRGLSRLIDQVDTAPTLARKDDVDRLHAMAAASFRARFVDADGSRTGSPGGLLDVLDGPSGDDVERRPNQLLSASLPDGPFAADPAAAARVVDAVATLVTPLGLRTLDPADPGYHGTHRGSPVQRDLAYHTGTVWPWLIGPYLDAVRAAGRPLDAVLDGLVGHVAEAGLGSVSETADGDTPHGPTGCPMQAWSVAELLRALSR